MSGSSDSTPLPAPLDAAAHSAHQEAAEESDGLDMPALKARIREAAAQRRAGRGLPLTAPSPSLVPSMTAAAPSLAGAGWSAVAGSLARVDRLADLGATVPEATTLPRPLRPLARLLRRAVLYLAGFLTRQQTDCNQALLAALHQLSGASLRRLNELERQLHHTQEALRDAERRLDELQQRPSQSQHGENSSDAPRASAA